ncbi:hypothetical protein P4O66_018891, partial [Electrophorus voltai]
TGIRISGLRGLLLGPWTHNSRRTHWRILGGGPVYGPGSDSAESYGDQPGYDNRHSEVDSTGSYDLYMDHPEGHAEYGERVEYSDVSLRSDMGSNYGEDPPMEVEEVLPGDSLADSDICSVVSRIDEPPARNSLYQGIQPHTTTRAPVPKPRRGKGEATPVPTPETSKVTGAPPEMGVRKSPPPKSRAAIPHRWVGLQPRRRLEDTLGLLSACLDSLAVHYVVLHPSLSLCPPPSYCPSQSLCPPLCLCLSVCPSPCLLSWSLSWSLSLSPLCPARAGPCRVACSSGFAIWHWLWGHSPIGCRAGSHALKEGLCHGTAPPPKCLPISPSPSFFLSPLRTISRPGRLFFSDSQIRSPPSTFPVRTAWLTVSDSPLSEGKAEISAGQPCTRVEEPAPGAEPRCHSEPKHRAPRGKPAVGVTRCSRSLRPRGTAGRRTGSGPKKVHLLRASAFRTPFTSSPAGPNNGLAAPEPLSKQTCPCGSLADCPTFPRD